MVKMYQTLNEALEDIGFDGRKRSATLLNGENASKKFDYGQPVMDEMIYWLNDHLKELGQDREQIHGFLELLTDLVANAYREDVQFHHAETVQTTCHLGIKGILMGTKQTKTFFTSEQLAKLRRGENVKSTNHPCGGHGTRIFVENTRGLLLLPEQKEIHISMLLEKFSELD